ncbi:MAG: hypothetical protein AB8G96_03030 [Phycisphaerales bacterium]
MHKRPVLLATAMIAVVSLAAAATADSPGDVRVLSASVGTGDGGDSRTGTGDGGDTQTGVGDGGDSRTGVGDGGGDIHSDSVRGTHSGGGGTPAPKESGGGGIDRTSSSGVSGGNVPGSHKENGRSGAGMGGGNLPGNHKENGRSGAGMGGGEAARGGAMDSGG